MRIKMNVLLDELLENTKNFLLKNDENKNINSNQDNYNIFSVLNLAHREIYHSRFLADLLNPNGLHNQGSLFLKNFLDMFPDKIPKTCDLKNTIVITEEVTAYGNLDISIKNNDFYIIIENKVWAGDQDDQLHRYSKTTHNGKEPIIIYLTPDGSSPSTNSLGNLTKDDIIMLSYRKNIQEWIKNCNEVVSSSNEAISILLKQYMEIIKFKKEDIMDIVIKNEELSEYLLLRKSLNQSIKNKQNELINSFFNQLFDRLHEFVENNPRRIYEPKSNGIYIYFYYHDNSYGLGLDANGLYIGYYKEERDYSEEEWIILVENNDNFKNKKSRYIYLDNKLTSTNEYFVNFIDFSVINKEVEYITNIIKQKII